MKKLLFIMAMVLPLFTFIGCSDDESANSQKVMINLYWKYENLEDTKIASPSIVALYDYEEAKNFDKEASVNALAYDGHIVLRDGTALTPKYVIGESLKFSANRDTIRMYIGRLNKEGRQYTGSVKGLSKDIVVTRLK